eukprot:2543183-Prymnesium_polylepis.1
MAVGYVSYGDGTRHAVIDNFPDTPLGRSATYIVCVALICSYILQMTPIFKIVEDVLMPYYAGPSKFDAIARGAVRSAIVAGTVLLSALVPDMEKMVALTGAFAFSLLCFVLPGLFYIKLRPDDGGKYERFVATALVPLGVVGAVVGVIGVITD